MEKRDVFLCHASEDKDAYVRPFATALASAGITYWIDEAEIHWGDRITKKINEGLVNSRYVVVFLTESFLNRNWPQNELSSALSVEMATGTVVVLPIMIASESIVFAQYPLLSDKYYMPWQGGLESVINTLRIGLGIEYKPRWSFSHPAVYSGRVYIEVVAEPASRRTPHYYTVRWGPWQYKGILNFEERESAFLVHMKGNDSLSVPLFFDISPASYVVFGQGDPPVGSIHGIHEINFGWKRVE